jgi:hypothetical protein
MGALNFALDQHLVQDGKGVETQQMHWWRWSWTGTESSATSATCIRSIITLGDAVTQDISTLIIQPTTPRCLSVTGGKLEEVGVVTIYGTNINDDPISEGLTLNGTTKVLGAKAFKTVTHILYPARTQGTTPTVTVGDSDKLGLPLCLPATACVYAHYDAGVLEDSAPTVTVDADEIEKNTMIPHTVPDGHAVIAIGYIYT